MRAISWCLLLTASAAIAGCKSPAATTSTTPVPVATPAGVFVAADTHAADASVTPSIYIHLYLYQITVPFGSVSQNETFWKHVDEQALNVAASTVLQENGIKVGLAPISEWEYFRKIITAQPCKTDMNDYSGTDVVNEEVPVSKTLDRQTLFYYDFENVLTGMTFDQCENFLNLSFLPAIRKPGTVRVTLCPAVRAVRSRLSYTALNNEQSVQVVTPIQIYDCNLTADLSPDSVLIIAPSLEAKSDLSLGNRFLVKGTGTEKLETVMLLVAHPVKIDDDAAPTTQP